MFAEKIPDKIPASALSQFQKLLINFLKVPFMVFRRGRNEWENYLQMTMDKCENCCESSNSHS